MPNPSFFNANFRKDRNKCKNKNPSDNYTVSVEEGWNFIQPSNGAKLHNKMDDSTGDLSQSPWEDSNKYRSPCYFSDSSFSNLTHYESTDAVSSSLSSEDNFITPQSTITETSVLRPGFDELDQIERLLTELERGVSVISLFNYFLENSELDSENGREFQSKLHEIGQVIERIRNAIQVYSRSSARNSNSRKTLPFPFVSRLKHNLGLYSQIVNKYQESLKNSIVDGAVSLYPDKSLEQILSAIDEIDADEIDILENDDIDVSYDIEFSNQSDKSKLVNYLKSKAKDIEYLEQSTIRLNSVYQDLYTLLSRRGENLSSLEEQILISSSTIEAGRCNMQKACRYRKSGWKRLLYFIALIVMTCLLLLIPNILPYIFGNADTE